jgi:F-type H+-transporting ATPase subunit delta
MNSRVLARRYALAFFRVLPPEQVDATNQDLSALAEVVAGPSGFAAALNHPLVTAAQKEGLVRKVLADASCPLLTDFLLLLLKRHRFPFFSLIVEEFQRLYDAARSMVCVQLKSAVPLSAAETARLTPALERLVKGTVKIIATVDPSIMGGLVINFQDKLLDASVKTRLRGLQEKMMALNTEILHSLDNAPVELV